MSESEDVRDIRSIVVDPILIAQNPRREAFLLTIYSLGYLYDYRLM